MPRVKKGQEYVGNIVTIREVEDCIRNTKKYTEGIRTMRKTHPVQGGDGPSKVFYKYYEVYPEMEVDWDMDAKDFFDWLWGDTPHIDLMFHYDYRDNKASLIITDGFEALKKLNKGIPGFEEIIARIIANEG